MSEFLFECMIPEKKMESFWPQILRKLKNTKFKQAEYTGSVFANVCSSLHFVHTQFSTISLIVRSFVWVMDERKSVRLKSPVSKYESIITHIEWDGNGSNGSTTSMPPSDTNTDAFQNKWMWMHIYVWGVRVGTICDWT